MTNNHDEQQQPAGGNSAGTPAIVYGVSMFIMSDGSVHIELSGDPQPNAHEVYRLVADCLSMLEARRIAATIVDLMKQLSAAQSRIVRPS